MLEQGKGARAVRLFWRLFIPFLGVALLSMAVLLVDSFLSQRAFFKGEKKAQLETVLRMAEPQFAPRLAPPDPAAVQALCDDVHARSGARLTLIAPDGVVLGDSSRGPETMDNHGRRPEILDAMEHGLGASERYSKTVDKTMLYVAAPVRRDGVLLGIARASVSLQSVQETLRTLQQPILWTGLLGAALAAGLALLLSRQISGPLNRMRDTVEKMAAGQLQVRPAAPNIIELIRMAEAISALARNLDEKIRANENLLREQQAILASMLEGLLVIDREERIVALNDAAAALLRTAPETARGRYLIEVARNAPLQQLVQQVLTADAPVEGDVVFREEADRYFQVHGTALRAANGDRTGALVVLIDVTRLRKLERVRRDFVANASHELRTPVTAIKGFAETLLTADAPEEERRRFTGIILRHADQLQQLIADLMELARIEHDVEHGPVDRRPLPVRPTLEQAIASCSKRAAARDIRFELTCPDDLEAPINDHMIERAVANLLDNAVKYGGEHSAVEVRAERAGADCVISVRDHGPGIAPHHLERIFERFYRIDKARSRKEGGTGLGLAIVRNIAEAHRGRVRAESRPGEGAVFYLHLPLAPPASP